MYTDESLRDSLTIRGVCNEKEGTITNTTNNQSVIFIKLGKLITFLN